MKLNTIKAFALGVAIVLSEGITVDTGMSGSGTAYGKDTTDARRIIGGMEFVYVPPGNFMMGSDDPRIEGHDTGDETPRHPVRIDGFWIGKYEVTQRQYKEITGTNPSAFTGSNNPVEQVSWNDAMDFCSSFGKKYNVSARLPYEAEWEYACRAGSTTKWYWGDRIHVDYLWFDANSGNTTHPVGKKKPNAFCLYDMSGNVWEWCMDWYDEEYYAASPAENPRGPENGTRRVLRGGSWFLYGSLTRSADRVRNYPAAKHSYIGFRVVITAP